LPLPLRKLVQAKVETSAALGPMANEDSGIKRSRFTDEQIVYALKQAELGTAADEIIRLLAEVDHLKHRISARMALQ